MIKVGDQVGFLDETGRGEVIRIEGKMAVVLTTEGLEIPYLLNKLVVYHTIRKKTVTRPDEKTSVKPEQTSPKHRPVHKKNTIKKEEKSPETDWENLSPKPVIKKVTDLTFRYDPSHDGHSREKKKSVKRLEETWEIDLHIHELTDDWRGLSNGEILHIQMQKCMQFLDQCMKGRAKRAVIIHGVGKGKLKQEIYMYLDRFTQLQYYDAPFQHYGQGATEVEFFYGKG